MIASTGHSATHTPHPLQSSMYTRPSGSITLLAGSLTPGTPITSTGQMSTHFWHITQNPFKS